MMTMMSNGHRNIRWVPPNGNGNMRVSDGAVNDITTSLLISNYSNIILSDSLMIAIVNHNVDADGWLPMVQSV